MGWLLAKVYDDAMRKEEEACFGAWRDELLGGLKGRVIEVGAGTGVNLSRYPRSLERLVLAEPDRHMRRRLSARASVSEVSIAEVIDAPAERLPFEDGSFDAVVSTLVLCSVKDVSTALSEIRRVLRPGGELVYMEHVRADPGTGLYRWQRLLNPLWRWTNENCHLTRDTAAAIGSAGFNMDHHIRAINTGGLQITSPTIRGRAARP
jgi:ubiquinone/menaquinone biosynthesis C-methylase UbiE